VYFEDKTMEEKIYFLPNENIEYSFEEITALIFDGKLQKKSLIWEKSLIEWTPLEKIQDFTEIFTQYDQLAEEKFKKAMGTDEETIQKREMKKMLDTVSEEEHIEPGTDWKYIFKWITLGVLILMIPVTYYMITSLVQTGTVFDTDDDDSIVEKLNMSDLKYRSGLIRIDEVKGVAIQKVERKEEDKILEEVILQMRREDAEKEQKEAKIAEKAAPKASLFDKVSDEEINAFRSSFLKKAGGGSVAKGSTPDSSFAKGGAVELTSKQINETLKKNYSTIRHCYERALKTDVGIRGRMEVTLHILGNGKVAKVINNTPTFKGTEMERCVSEMITGKWQFPSFDGTLTTVTIPFVLTAQ
jgi:hypothetical protein